MTITKSPYINNPDILFCHEARSTRPVALDFGEAEMLPAGTPISCEGKAVNDVTALGVLLYDTWKGYGSGQGVVLISGHVDLAKAQEHCGLTYTAEAKAAMKQVCFVGDTEVPSGGGGSVDMSEYFETVYGDTLTWDGNTEGLLSVTIDMGDDGTLTYYKVSDEVPSYILLTQYPITIKAAGVNMEVPQEMVNKVDDKSVFFMFGVVVATENANIMGSVFPETGTWLTKDETMDGMSLTVKDFDGYKSMILRSAFIPSNDFVVSIGLGEGNEYIADCYFNDVETAIMMGKNVFFKIKSYGSDMTETGAFTLLKDYYYTPGRDIYIKVVDVFNGAIKLTQFTFYSDNRVEVETIT